MATDADADDVDRLEQEMPVDPTENEALPDGGPGDAAEADWLDQQIDAPLNEDDRGQD